MLNFSIIDCGVRISFNQLRPQAKPHLFPEAVLNVFNIALPKSRKCNK